MDVITHNDIGLYVSQSDMMTCVARYIRRSHAETTQLTDHW